MLCIWALRATSGQPMFLHSFVLIVLNFFEPFCSTFSLTNTHILNRHTDLFQKYLFTVCLCHGYYLTFNRPTFI